MQTGGKVFLKLRILKVCESFLLRQIKKLAVYFGLYKSSLRFKVRDDQPKTVYEK